MDFLIRNAVKEDCPAIMELVRELAVFERAPEEVNASLEHFESSGFGPNPVWWGFVAVESGQHSATELSITAQDPMLAQLMEDVSENINTPASVENLNPEGEGSEIRNLGLPADKEMEMSETTVSIEQHILLPEAVTPVLPDTLDDLQPAAYFGRERVVAFALYYIRYSTWKGQRMYLEDLYVREGWRGKGVGTALMDALIGRAKAENLHGISWQVLEWNEAAINFYRRYNARFDSEWTNVAIDV